MKPLLRLSTWLNQSVGHRLTLVSVSTAVALVVVLGVTTFPLFSYQAWKNFSGQSENELSRLADQMELRLDVMEQNLGQLAQNSFVVNSLVDSTGRELYLQPILRDFHLPFGMMASLLIFDANFEPIGSNQAESASVSAAIRSIAERAMGQQKALMAIQNTAGGAIVVTAIPIYYPVASSFEGVLVSQVSVKELFVVPDLSATDGCVVLAAGGTRLLESGCAPGEAFPDTPRVLRAGFSLEAGSLTVGVHRSHTRLLLELAGIFIVFSLAGAAAIYGTYLFSRRIGQNFAEQLALLSKTSQELAINPTARTQVVWNRPDEIGRFAQAFNSMVRSLQDLQASLEARVVERTRDLQASQRDYASLAQAAPVGIFRTDVEGRRLYVNDLWCRLADLSPEESLGEGWVNALHPEDREAVLGAWSASIRANRPFSMEYRFKRKNGATVWVFGQAMAILDEEGTVLGFVGTVTDISERRRAEDALRRTKEQYRSVVENIKEVVFQTDAVGNWIFLNRAWEEITGFPVNETLKRSFLDYVHPDDRDRNFALFKPLIERQKDYCRHEVRYLHKNGGFRWIEVFARLTFDHDNQVIGTSGTLTDVTERRAAEEKLERIAHYDALTQLPNRILLADRMRTALAQAKRSGTLVGVCYMDLDGFKAVNDEHGHATGDLLLVEVARRLTQTLRSGDTVARLGGDEFVALLIGLKSVQQCEEVLQRTIRAISEPMMLDGVVTRVSSSIGVAFYPETADDAEALLRQADHAMYEAKQSGKNRFQFFNSEQDQQARNYRARLKELEGSIVREEFVLHYQPQVNLETGQVLGVEALIRWNHPSLGLLLPGDFLVGLNNPPLESAIDHWVLTSALSQIEVWRGQGLELPVSINISANTLEDDDFVSRVRSALEAHPGAEGLLELEVLESTALGDVDRVARVIRECSELGVSFALDDFGTGYSSLTYFRRLPAETLKIDMSFVRSMLEDPDDLAIVKGVIGLTKAFGRRAIAEGVTTVAQCHALQSLGCDAAQGFGIARPMPPADVPAWILGQQDNLAWKGRADLEVVI